MSVWEHVKIAAAGTLKIAGWIQWCGFWQGTAYRRLATALSALWLGTSVHKDLEGMQVQGAEALLLVDDDGQTSEDRILV